MKYLLFSVFDVKTSLYSQPFMQRTNDEAIRSFRTTCSDENTNLNKYPEDYSLYCLGEFKEDTGELIPMPPKHLANASEYVKNSL